MNTQQLLWRFPYTVDNGRKYCWILYSDEVVWRIKENEKYIPFSTRSGDIPVITINPAITLEQVANQLSGREGHYPIYYIEDISKKDICLDQLLYLAHAGTVSCISRGEKRLKWAVKTGSNINRLCFDKESGLVTAISLSTITKISLDGKVKDVMR